MKSFPLKSKWHVTVAALALGAAAVTPQLNAAEPAADLSSLRPIAKVDPRFQSYNIEMVEVTGGRFWAPHGSGERYRMRPPLDLESPRVRALAKALGPAYVRVSGTWANTTYLPAEGEVVSAPPPGFKQVLSRDKWRQVIAFAKTVDAEILTSFPASAGARNPDGSWNPTQAQRLTDLTREAGGRIYAAELFNEPTMPQETFPKGYTVADYARDFRIFRDWARRSAPQMKIAGPGGAGEGSALGRNAQNIARGYFFSDELMRPNPSSVDLFVYHHYEGISARCMPQPVGSKEEALQPRYLDGTLREYEHYAALRDQYEPGKPIWLNETGQAACGGSPWACTFLDTFRYVNQLGALAQRDVKVAHNTLAASDYALVDYDTLTPRPSYWAAVLWKRTMGATVLESPSSPEPEVRLYAHCLPTGRGGVGLVAINLGEEPKALTLPRRRGTAWLMSGSPVDTRMVSVNGRQPVLGTDLQISGLVGAAVQGRTTLPGQTIGFYAFPDARNRACG